MVRHRDCGIVGDCQHRLHQQFKVDYGIIGISGIDLDGTLLDFRLPGSAGRPGHYRQLPPASFLVADHTKFGRNAMVQAGEHQ